MDCDLQSSWHRSTLGAGQLRGRGHRADKEHRGACYRLSPQLACRYHLSRLLQTDTLDGKGKDSPLKLISLYCDQRPPDDLSRSLAASHRFRISSTIEDTLTLGTTRNCLTPRGSVCRNRRTAAACCGKWCSNRNCFGSSMRMACAHTCWN